MGNWVINIEGTGCHHNGRATDAERLAQVAVKALKDAGQIVEHATITYGGRLNVMPASTVEQALSDAGNHAVE